MSQTLEYAIAKIRELPEAEHDSVATALMYYVDEIPTLRDQVAIQDGRDAYNPHSRVVIARSEATKQSTG